MPLPKILYPKRRNEVAKRFGKGHFSLPEVRAEYKRVVLSKSDKERQCHSEDSSVSLGFSFSSSFDEYCSSLPEGDRGPKEDLHRIVSPDEHLSDSELGRSDCPFEKLSEDSHHIVNPDEHLSDSELGMQDCPFEKLPEFPG